MSTWRCLVKPEGHLDVLMIGENRKRFDEKN